MQSRFIWALLCAIFLSILPLASASAQATRTWVSGVGDDANPCSRTAPCKTFAGAISKTAAHGEINCIDPGGFGALTITKSITIKCDNTEAGVLVSGTNGITVNVLPNDRVVLEGLDFEGLGTGLNGINVIGSGRIFVHNVKIKNFTQNGINLVGTAGARVIVADSQILNNGGGINVQGQGGVANALTIANSIVDSNTNFAVQTNGASNAIGFTASILTGSPAGISLLNGGVAVSFGANNLIVGTGAPTSTVPLK